MSGLIAILSIIINGTIAVLIYKSQNNRQNEEIKAICTSILEESSRMYTKLVKESLEVIAFCDFLRCLSNKRIEKMRSPKSGEYEEQNDCISFTVELLKLRDMINNNWIELPLCKYEKYEEYLDKYKNQKLKFSSVTIKPSEVQVFVIEIEKYLSRAVHYQKNMIREIPKLYEFIDAEAKSKRDLFREFDNCQSKADVKYYTEKYNISINWSFISEKSDALEKYSEYYKELYYGRSGVLNFLNECHLPDTIKEKYFGKITL